MNHTQYEPSLTFSYHQRQNQTYINDTLLSNKQRFSSVKYCISLLP